MLFILLRIKLSLLEIYLTSNFVFNSWDVLTASVKFTNSIVIMK